METGINFTEPTASHLLHTPQISPENGRTGAMYLQCEVMFGSPSSKCGGNGICKIVAKANHPSASFKRTSCSHAKGLFTTLDNGNTASLVFRRDWLCANLMRKHFRHGILEMPEPCIIPSGLATSLGLKTSVLPAGLHLIEDYGTHFRINFQHTVVI